MTRLTMNRLTGLPTLRIDPATSIPFSYRDEAMAGAGGDTIATALFAAGVRIFSRSLKYHRPRGLYSLDGVCANTMMRVDGVPNLMAETVPLAAGMTVEAQNFKGTPDSDRLGFLDRLDWAMPAGFYYRLMHKPAALWPRAAEAIRKLAGLGVIEPEHRTPGRYDKIFLNAEVCVVGGGPAGMRAALAAARRGARVVLLERRPWLGGFFDHRIRPSGDGTPLCRRARELAAAVEAEPNIRLFLRTSLIGVYGDRLATAFEVGDGSQPFEERYVEIRAAGIVVATGCIERPLLFENNERPGVMQVACAHRLAHTYGLRPGRRAVFSVGDDLGLECAADLADLGVDVAWVAEARPDGHDSALVGRLEERGVRFRPGWVATEAKGRKLVRGAVLRPIAGTDSVSVSCDLLVAGAGTSPLTAPLTMAGGRLAFDRHTGCFLPGSLPAGMRVAGRITGLVDPAAIEASGRVAGLAAVADCGEPGIDVADDLRAATQALASLPGAARGCSLVTAPGSGRKAFVCFDEDATVKNVRQAVARGFDVPELIKRFAAVSLGPGQGGIPGHNLPLLVAENRGLPPETLRPTTSRAPMVPVAMATLAGSNHDMCKRTPLHETQDLPGAIFRRIGAWQRVRYFTGDLTCREEIANVRSNVGMLDASTLGKFRLWGPNALDALQRVYVSDMSKLRRGRVKYSAMCNDDGCVVDDGVVVKRGENEYYLTTSSGRAGKTIEWFRYHTRYDDWDFKLVNLTDATGVINLAGPNARRVLEAVTDADVGNLAFRFSRYRELTVAGTIPVRAMRLGFVGELCFELHVAASYAQSLWELLAEAGADLGIRNFGVEAQNVMRMEKGHLIIGSETEQRTTLHDVGLGFLWYRDKPEAKTVGAVALRQTENQPNRLKLVGFEMHHPSGGTSRLSPSGGTSHLSPSGGTPHLSPSGGTSYSPRDGSIIVDERIRGWVCIARYSHALGKSIGMALVDQSLAAEGTPLEIFEDGCGGKLRLAHVVQLPFYDPQGLRMRM